MATTDEYVYLKLVWNYNGFKKNDLNSSELEELQKIFLKLRSAYAKWTRKENMFDKLNEKFKCMYPDIFPIEDETLGAYVYGSWLACQINMLIYEHFYEIGLDDSKLQPFIFLDGSIPDFRCGLKQHPGWSIDISLLPI